MQNTNLKLYTVILALIISIITVFVYQSYSTNAKIACNNKITKEKQQWSKSSGAEEELQYIISFLKQRKKVHKKEKKAAQERANSERIIQDKDNSEKIFKKK